MQAPIVASLSTVHGQVQGVGFRWSTRRVAEDLGLSGWARNRPDGSVEVFAQGSAASLDGLRAFLEQGPPGAVVVTVDAVPVKPDETLEGFQITLGY